MTLVLGDAALKRLAVQLLGGSSYQARVACFSLGGFDSLCEMENLTACKVKATFYLAVE